jgi:dienelactone hydrolase
MTGMRWIDEGVRDASVREREFRLERDGHGVPGVVWHPPQPRASSPLVLLGHGGSGHKRSAKMLRMARIFAGEYGWWAAAIDGPAHGARGGVQDSNDAVYRQMWQRPGVVQAMVDDWRATLDALCALQEIDAARVGYWGVSMGTMFGIPLVASEPRIRAAVLGKAGMRGPSVVRSGIDAHFEVHAPKVSIPLLFGMQWHDERFDRDGQLELFDMLASPDKRLHAYPGPHAQEGPEAFEVTAAFLRRHLQDA